MVKLNPKEVKMRAVGRRKSASARVMIVDSGKGEITVNSIPVEKYFPFLEMRSIIFAPLKAVGKNNDLTISAKVRGGGKMAQAVALQHGIARILVKWNSDFRKSLKSAGFLTRDPRVKERKKPGLKKARRAPQWSKR